MSQQSIISAIAFWLTIMTMGACLYVGKRCMEPPWSLEIQVRFYCK